MSNSTSRSTARSPVRVGATLSRKCRQLTETGLRAAAFWGAVLLPLAYVPVFLGMTSVDGAWSLLALLSFHIACVVVGHEHNLDDERSRDTH